MVNAVLWVLSDGGFLGRDLPEHYPHCNSVYTRFCRCSEQGICTGVLRGRATLEVRERARAVGRIAEGLDVRSHRVGDCDEQVIVRRNWRVRKEAPRANRASALA